MRTKKHLAKQFAVVAAVAALCGTSAFAETRHRDETNGGHERSHVERNDRNRESRGDDRGARQQQPAPVQSEQLRSGGSRESHDWNRGSNNNQRSNNNSRDWNRDRVNVEQRSNGSRDWNRGSNNSRDWNRGHNDSYRGGHAPSFYNGRINRFERWNNGFRVYIGGAPYPFFVPEAYFRSHGFRVGLSIRLGGYYNPLGYYDYYDDPYYYGGGYSTPVARGDVRGVVESVDYRRGTLVVRDDASGEFITTLMRGRDRTFDALRPGDMVVLQGDWVRGTFEAYRADLLDSRDYDRGRY